VASMNPRFMPCIPCVGFLLAVSLVLRLVLQRYRRREYTA